MSGQWIEDYRHADDSDDPIDDSDDSVVVDDCLGGLSTLSESEGNIGEL